MAADRDVIREYLVSLGYSIDKSGAKKFAEALGVTNARALALTGAIAGITIAAEEMVRSFARGMTNLYYASKRTLTPVAQLQAFRFAAEQIGISGEDALATIEAVSAELRKNPGKQALMQMLGVSEHGITNLEKMHSLVQGLNQKYPYFVAQDFAAQFGIPEHVFFQLTNNYEELLKKEREHKALLQSLGMDTDEAAAAARRYQQDIGELGLRFDLLKQKASAAMLPAAKAIIQNMTRSLDMMNSPGGLDWLKKDKGRNLPGFISELFSPLILPGASRLVEDAKKGGAGAQSEKVDPEWPSTDAMVDRFLSRDKVDPEWPSTKEMVDRFLERAKSQPGAAAAAGDLRGSAAKIALEFGIPPSLFAALIKKESNWDPRAVSNKGAMGLTQLMPGTAKDRGVTEPFDPLQNLRGGAGYLREQYERFGNDWRKALAAYNFGPNRDFSPAYATYADPILRAAEAAEKRGGDITLHQKTDIHVSGTSDPAATGRAVANEQERVNADLTRAFAAVPR